MRKLKCWLGYHEWYTIKFKSDGTEKTQVCCNCNTKRDWGGTWFSGWQKPYKDNG